MSTTRRRGLPYKKRKGVLVCTFLGLKKGEPVILRVFSLDMPHSRSLSGTLKGF